MTWSSPITASRMRRSSGLSVMAHYVAPLVIGLTDLG
jgi:hypothetical protein